MVFQKPSRAILLALILLAAHCLSQHQRVTFERFSMDQGMSGRIVPCIYQDKQGFMWFGSWGGLDRYDGYTFTSFKHDPADTTSLGNSFVLALCEDNTGNFWVGTADGFDKLDRETGTFTHYRNNVHYPASLSNNHINAICEDRTGMLWIGTNGGLNRLDKTTGVFSRFQHNEQDPTSLSNNSVNAICEDRSGTLWIGTGGFNEKTGGLDVLDRSKGVFRHYTHDDHKVGSLIDNWVTSLFEDKSGMLWVGTNGGLERFDPATETFVHYQWDARNPESLSSNNVKSICEDESGVIWVGTWPGVYVLASRSKPPIFTSVGAWPGGVNALDTKNGKFTRYFHDDEDPHSLSKDWVMAVYRERSGTLWISTFLGGINKLDRTKALFAHYSRDNRDPQSLSSNEVSWMAEDADGAIWLGTGVGLDWLDPKTESIHRYVPHDKRGKKVTNIDAFCEDGLGSRWINTPRGAAMLERATATIEYLSEMRVAYGSVVPTQMNLLGSDKHGGLFLSGNVGLYHFDPVSRKITQFHRVAQQSIVTVCEGASGMLWIATRGGLLSFDRGRDSLAFFTSDPKNPSSLSSGPILTLYEDRKGTLWLGPGGLRRLDRATGKFTHFFEKDGLPHQAVMAILEDDHNNLWLSTPKGLSKYDPRTGRFKNYDVSYGLHGNEFHARSAIRARNGEMYFGGTGGFTRFHPDSIKDNPFVPPVAITVFKKFEKPERFGREIRLSYEVNFISFEFAALSYTTPSRNQYAYKMEGLDKDWVYSWTRRYASYPHLEPGEYVFRVKGSNNDGVWNEEGTSIAVIIIPPWWKTWWFTTFFWLTVAGSVGGGIRYIEMKKLKKRIQQLEQEQAILQERDRTRDRIASDLHDDVASTLGSIALYTESLNRGLRETSKPTRELVQRIGTLLNEAQDAVSDIVWSVTPRHDTLEDLLWRMKDLASDLCSAHGIAYAVEVPKNIDVVQLPEKLRKSIYLIFKEAINNIIKHAQAKSVSMRVEIINSVLEMVIEDDGIGFTTDEQHQRTSLASEVDDHPVRGHGLRNMTKRAEEMGGSLSILSTPGKGTTLRLSVSMA